MGDRRRRTIYEVIHSNPIIEEREPDFDNIPRRRRTVTIQETRVHRRHQQREERSRSRPRSPSRHRPRVPTPSPPRRFRAPSPPPRRNIFNMSPTDSPTNKPFVPLPTPLPTKKDEEKAKKKRPSVQIVGDGHRKSKSDTVYNAGLISPWTNVEDRSPHDYEHVPKSKSQSPRPRADREVYERIDGQEVVRRYPSRRGDSTYITRRPGTQKEDDFPRPVETYRDRYKDAKATTKVLKKALAEETEKAQYNHDAAKQQESLRLAEIRSLQEEIRRLRMEKLRSDSKAEDAEKRYNLSRIQRIEAKEQELQRREREWELEKKQWKEIEALPSPKLGRSKMTLPPLISQTKSERRNTTTSSPYLTNSALATQPSQTLISGNAGLEAIYEAQRDEDRRRAQESRRPRRIEDEDPDYLPYGITKETGRNSQEPRRQRRDDRYK